MLIEVCMIVLEFWRTLPDVVFYALGGLILLLLSRVKFGPPDYVDTGIDVDTSAQELDEDYTPEAECPEVEPMFGVSKILYTEEQEFRHDATKLYIYMDEK